MGMDRLFAAAYTMQGDWNQLYQGAGLFVVGSVVYPVPSVMASFSPDTGKVPRNRRRT